MARPVMNREDMSTLRRNVVIDAVTGCWEWVGSIQSGGYGQIEIGGRIWLAHRLSWALHHCIDWDVPLEPPALLVLHRCDNPPCCNPEHLFEGTHRDNHDDAVAKGRFDPLRLSRFSHGPRRRRLTDDQVREIRTGRDTDTGYAMRFGVGKTTVRDIRNRRSKRLVPD